MSIRPLVRWLVRLHVWLYQRTGGRLGSRTPLTASPRDFMLNLKRPLRILLLTSIGRRTGQAWTIPLLYVEADGCYVTAASNGGSPTAPIWFLNLQAHPKVTIQVLDKVLPVLASVAAGERRTRLWAQLETMYPPYADYQRLCEREIPVVVLEPER